MKCDSFRLLIVLIAVASGVTNASPGQAQDQTSQPVRPGEPNARPFWNSHALRFIYAPAFDLPKVKGAVRYRFTITDGGGKTHTFTAPLPSAVLTPVWEAVPEGYTTLTVEALDADDQALGTSATRSFYRSPGFSGEAGAPPAPYEQAGRSALRAIFQAPHVQHWLTHAKPDPSYARFCYPNKVIGGLLRAMSTYAAVAESESDRAAATEIARRCADYLLSIRLPEGSPYAHFPPTYAINVDKPTPVTPQRVKEHWLMIPSAIDAALGLLDFYDVSKDRKYLDAAKAIADTFVRTQETDGTWALMVNDQTGDPISPQRLIPTWVIFFFDRLQRQYHLEQYADPRGRAWDWIVHNPLKTYQWDAQFEDIKLRKPYVNLSREQACDVAMLLLSAPQPIADERAQAEELLRFAEDQFVVWAPVTDVAGWKQAMPNRRKNTEAWITPCVLEQYVCYDPVARSSAILINTYLKAHAVTQNPMYFEKARALGNGMLSGQAWLAEAHGGNGEIPTWNMKRPPINWLNNSFYAAEAILNLAAYQSSTASRDAAAVSPTR